MVKGWKTIAQFLMGQQTSWYYSQISCSAHPTSYTMDTGLTVMKLINAQQHYVLIPCIEFHARHMQKAVK